MVRLRDGEGPPLYCLHGWPGDLLRYRAILPHLPAARSVIGLIVQPMDPREPLLLTIEEMAHAAANRIISAQPSGPVQLVGHSLGGLVAFETSRALHELGREVRPVVIVDAVLDRARPWSVPRRARDGWRDRRLRSRGVSDVAARDRWKALNLANDLAYRRYRPRPAPVPAVLVTSSESVSSVADRRLGWGALVDVHPAGGTHLSILEAPHVAAVAAHL
jgi:thioesterase domain-containing protein